MHREFSGGVEDLMGLLARHRLPSRSVMFGAQLLSLLLIPAWLSQPIFGLGLVSAHSIKPVHTQLLVLKRKRAPSKNYTELRPRPGVEGHGQHDHSKHGRHGKLASKALLTKKKAKIAKAQIYFPQDYLDSLKSTTVVPGVVYKHFKGPLVMNVLDIDTVHAPVHIRPILAGDAFDSLQNISQHAKSSHALAAINANYFKKNGTPLGTLIMDGEWVSGPIYDRVSLGIAKSGRVRVDRVNLAGILETSNPDVPRIWINNINQPRRTGSRLVVYTRRWGSFVRLPYEGNLVAVNASGQVTDKTTQSLTIPYGGYVLSDSKDGQAGKLAVGDTVKLTWRTAPSSWSDVDQAVSGGPLLIKDGKVFVDLKDEVFRAGWTSCQIKARTAAGVTSDHHLLLVTVEGPHTLWDLAKFLRQMGAVNALNLDGGGSTAMFVNGETVTQSKRKVASAIGIFSDNRRVKSAYQPKTSDLVQFGLPDLSQPAPAPAPALPTALPAKNRLSLPISTNQTLDWRHTEPQLPSLPAAACLKVNSIADGATSSAPLPGK